MVLHTEQAIAMHDAISTLAQMKHWELIPECCKQDVFFKLQAIQTGLVILLGEFQKTNKCFGCKK